jgi:hypothetical protein
LTGDWKALKHPQFLFKITAPQRNFDIGKKKLEVDNMLEDTK